jgi:hypothetical protein
LIGDSPPLAFLKQPSRDGLVRVEAHRDGSELALYLELGSAAPAGPPVASRVADAPAPVPAAVRAPTAPPPPHLPIGRPDHRHFGGRDVADYGGYLQVTAFPLDDGWPALPPPTSLARSPEPEVFDLSPGYDAVRGRRLEDLRT